MKNEPFAQFEALHPEEKMLRLIVKRWEKGKVITSDVFDAERRYFLRDVPWLATLQMIHLEGIADSDAKKFLEEIREKAKAITARQKRQPDICQYVMVECLFETIDPILGGDLTTVSRKLAFPRKHDKTLYIRPNWLYGYLRDNSRLWNLPGAVAKYITPSEGIFEEQPTTFQTEQIRVKEGHVVYEAIPPKCRFKSVLHFPLKGYDGFDSLEKWIKAIRKIEMHPLRGIGSNARVFGGRIKLVETKELD